MSPRDLPIHELESDIVAPLHKRSNLILHAPAVRENQPGILQILLDQGLLGADQGVILQPRRITARAATGRSVRLGHEAGYSLSVLA